MSRDVMIEGVLPPERLFATSAREWPFVRVRSKVHLHIEVAICLVVAEATFECLVREVASYVDNDISTGGELGSAEGAGEELAYERQCTNQSTQESGFCIVNYLKQIAAIEINS